MKSLLSNILLISGLLVSLSATALLAYTGLMLFIITEALS